MLPVARSALRRIGDSTDVVTFVSRYTASRFAAAFGPDAALEHTCRPASTQTGSRPDVGQDPGRSCGPSLSDWASTAHGGVPVAAGAAQGSGHADSRVAVNPAASGWRRADDRRRRPLPGRRCDRLAVEGLDVGRPRRRSPGECPARNFPPTTAMADVFADAVPDPRAPALDVEGRTGHRISGGLGDRRARARRRQPRAARRKRCSDGETGLVVDGRVRWSGDRRRRQRAAGRPGRSRRRAMGAARTGSGSSRTGGGMHPGRPALRPAGGGFNAAWSWRKIASMSSANFSATTLPPLDLQRRGQFAGVLGEVDRQDAELADRLRTGHRAKLACLTAASDLGDAGRDRRPGRPPSCVRRPCRCAASSRRTTRGRS